MIRPAYADAASVIPTRLSFRQLLVLISYISLECSLPATIGDTRQLEYLIQRDEKEWNPRVGLETLADMRQQSWQDICLDAQRGWKKLHNYLAQQNAIDSTVSCEQLRDHLYHLLRGIEQISAQGLNALCDQRPASKLPNSLIREKGSLILVCVSLSVIPTATDHVPLRSLLMDPERQLIKEMCHQLRGSAVFQNPVTENQLWGALESIELLFAGEEDVSGCSCGNCGSICSESRYVEFRRRYKYLHRNNASFAQSGTTYEVSEVLTEETIVEESLRNSSAC
ncbi:hypothetical protein ASPZODRAFT_137548 [Penicilliopsis zonata CBS 506.65]|uniref:Uncharacterized protein n=1 Tax=Penicilliopsis zonata CBS 506.65 TaxID=1073090 RepID=A0A1L9S4K6_9EURO|nr:hypothetical protein ASPZODRAFT_137548 [Penicilliopsis zonata CBS 506.65]OJJ42043.1 hypothetical protein ASPZODRAFT_137548 [Penicilliopsis zonata CBS 506.65]